MAALAACKGKPTHHAPDDAAVALVPGDAAVPWPELAKLPLTDAVRVISLPTKASTPRFTVGGPVLVGTLAVVSSSQFGFLAVDYQTRQIAWTKPAGEHVAPPAVVDHNVVLVGDCVTRPDVPDEDTLLGCARVVTPTGTDQAYVGIHANTRAIAAFAGADWENQGLFADGSNVIWRRGGQAVAIDLLSGVAKQVPADDPPIVVTYKDKTWRVRRNAEGQITAEGTPPWQTHESYTTLLGAVYLPDQAPMIRMSQAMHRGHGEMMMFDVDATGSLNGQVSLHPVPGIGLVGHAIDKVGDVVLAVRLDTSLERAFIAGYAANALLMWVYPLPQKKRADPIGVAISSDAVVVFHDGDTLTVLPELSAPPTAPGAVREPSENTTP